MSLSAKKLLLFGIYFTAFLPSFAIKIAGYKTFIQFILLGIILAFLIILKYKKYYTYIVKFTQQRPVQCILLYIVWTFLGGLLATTFTSYKVSLLLSAFPIKTGLLLFPLLAGFFATMVMQNHEAIKTVFWMLYGSLLIGIVEFLIFLSHITPLEKIYWFFNNFTFMDRVPMHFYINVMPRIQIMFDEPSTAGAYLILILPMVYGFALTKYKIFKKPNIDRFVKVTLPIFFWFCLVMTMSPISILFGLVITGVYFISRMHISYKNLVLYGAVTIGLVMLFFHIMNTMEFENVILMRIQKVLQSFGDMDKLALQEPSLATRLIEYINMFMIFLNSPVFGCGIGNLRYLIAGQLVQSPTSLTEELIMVVMNPTMAAYTPNIFFSSLAEVGAVGVMFYYMFIFSLMFYVRKAIKATAGLSKDYFALVFGFLVAYFCFSFYSSQIYIQHYWIIFGITIGLVYKNIVRNKVKHKKKSLHFNM